MDKKGSFEYLSDYCYRHGINSNADAMSCFCLSFWNDKLSNNKNAIRFKKWLFYWCKRKGK